MFKFLRKYNKWILAVGGTLLMIVFLIPQAITTLSQCAAQEGAVWATVGPDDEDVSSDIRRQCVEELRLLEPIQRQGMGPTSTDRPDHWYLLTREASLAGLTGALASDQLPADQLNAVSSMIGKSAQADRALGKRMAIDKMLEMYLSASKLSDNRIRREAEKMFHSVDARFVILEASDSFATAEPSEDEIAAQYEEFREVAPRDTADTGALAAVAEAADESSQGFGYRLPDRFKLEWLRIEADSVRAMIEASDALGNIALFRHWQRNETARGFPPFDSDDDSESSDSSDDNGIPDIVRTDLLSELTTAKLAEIERYVTDQLFATWRSLRIAEGYRVLPDDWDSTKCDLEAMANELQSEFPGLELPSYRAVNDRWLRVEDVAELKGLESAGSDRYGANPTSCAALIAAAQEFGGDAVILTQVGIADPPLRDRDDDSLIFFRITEADPSRPPHDVAEVRDEVVRDLKRKSHFERLEASMDSLVASARAEGLLGVALANDVDVQGVTQVHIDSPSLLSFQLQNNFQLQRMSSLPVLGAHASTVERIIDHAMALPRDQDVRSLPVEDRIFALAVDDRMTVIVVEILRQAALSNDGFKQLASLGLQNVILGQELIDIDPPLQDVFGFDALAARHSFEVKRRDDAETLPDEEPVANADGP